jgi:CelD/BcsL family acetyltransferase involved in cellulose biosynthesis
VPVIRGHDALDLLGTPLDELHDVVAAPLTARRPWLQAWVDSYTDAEPVAFTVPGRDGRLDAAAVLVVRRRAGVHRVVAAGHGQSDAMVLPARGVAPAGALSRAVAGWLGDLPGPWSLALRHLVSAGEVTTALSEDLPYVRSVPGDVLPMLRADGDRSLRQYVSRNHHQQVQRLRNRMRREGVDAVVEHRRTAEEVLAVMPHLERVMRARDADVGRACALDDPGDAAFFRAVVEAHARRGVVHLTTLWLDGELGAYVLCFDDRGTFRMWNCRFDPRWSRFGVGKVAMDESVEHALSAGARVYDFMRGEEQYKDSYANDRVDLVDLFAWSNLVLAARGRALLTARAGVTRLERGGAWGARVAHQARRVGARVRL